MHACPRNADRRIPRPISKRCAPPFHAVRDGTILAGGSEIVRKALALSVEKVRTTPIDLSQTYTNEFISTP